MMLRSWKKERNHTPTPTVLLALSLALQENIYVTRKKKKLRDDDVMTCYCSHPGAGNPGCTADCMNRCLYVECIGRQALDREERRVASNGVALLPLHIHSTLD